MFIIDKLFGRRTNFSAGGAILSGIPASATLMRTPDKFVAPRKLDFRDMCIQTSNQQQTPHCTGYSTAGYIEVQNWKTLHYPEQIDGDKIYLEAKKLDGYVGNGTWTKFSVQAAMNLGLIKGTIEYIVPDRRSLMFAIHEHSVCIGSLEITNEWNAVGKDGIIPTWNNSNKIGGHAILICGYSEDGIYIQNSWGSEWGLYGFALLRWEQFDKQFRDGVIIRRL